MVDLVILPNCVKLLSSIFLLFTRLIWKWTKDNIWKVWSPQGSSATGRNIPIYIRIPWIHSKSLFNIETLSSCGYYGCLLNVTLSEKCAMIPSCCLSLWVENVYSCCSRNLLTLLLLEVINMLLLLAIFISHHVNRLWEQMMLWCIGLGVLQGWYQDVYISFVTRMISKEQPNWSTKSISENRYF